MKPADIPRLDPERATHLRDYWRIVWDGRWMVLAVFVVVLGVVAVATFLSTPIYRAEATVDIQARSKRIAPVADVASLGASDYGWFSEERYFNTQFEIIKSRSVAESVFEKLDLHNHPRFHGSSDPIAGFIRMVRVEPLADTGIAKVSLEGADSKEVTLWVNTLVDAYVDRNLDQALQETRRAVNALLQELQPLRERLQQTDAARFDYAEKSGVYVPEDYQKALNERVKQLEVQYTEARVKRLDLEAVFNKIEDLTRTGGAYLSLPQVNSNPTIRILNEEYIKTERELNRLLVSLGSNHPRVVERRNDLEKARQKIEEESAQIINSIRTDYALNRDREVNLAREISRTKEESLRTSQKASSYNTLASDATETRRLFELFNTRVKEISLNSELLSNNIRILDRAVVPRIPVRPRKSLNLMVGMVLGLGLGVATAFFLDYLDNTIKSSEQIEQLLGLNALAVVPRMGEDTASAAREAFQTLRTSLLFSSRNRADRVILMTSTGPQEGKTSTTVSLARALAAGGDKVCIVDCDLRRPMVHAHLNLRRQQGLTNYLMADDESGWREYVRAADVAGVWAITCGAIPPNPPQVFGSERFIRLLATLKANYDWVLVDSPPVGSLTDSIILASVVDMVILVIRYQQTDREIVRRACASLRNVNSNVVGAILNAVDPERSHYKSYYDYSYYLDVDTSPGTEGESVGGNSTEEVRSSTV